MSRGGPSAIRLTTQSTTPTARSNPERPNVAKSSRHHGEGDDEGDEGGAEGGEEGQHEGGQEGGPDRAADLGAHLAHQRVVAGAEDVADHEDREHPRTDRPLELGVGLARSLRRFHPAA
jgi:hypothetical protein